MFKYFIIILIVSTNYIFVHLLDNKVFLYTLCTENCRYFNNSAHITVHGMNAIKFAIRDSQTCHHIHFEAIYHPSATTVSQLKIYDFSGERFKGFEVLYFSM